MFSRATLLLVLSTISFTVFSQTVIKTPAELLAENRGKLLQIREQLLNNQTELLKNQEAMLEAMEEEFNQRILLFENMIYLKENFGYEDGDYIIYVNASQQKLYLVKGYTIEKTYSISTGKNGVGNIEDSEMTPEGVHYIRTKIGDSVNFGTIFEGAKKTDKEAEVILEAEDSEDDYVTSRILWLDGKEDDKNNGGMVDSYDRRIYIHGTHEEGLIGQPVSHGCIRMLNKDVIELFDLVDEGTLVVIGNSLSIN